MLRRSRRACASPPRALATLTLVSATLVSATVATSAHAQLVPQGQGYAADNLNPAERGSDFFTAESLDLRGHGRFAFGVLVGNAYRTVADRRQDGGVNASVVRNQAFLYPGATFTLFDRVRVAFQVPLAFFSDGNQAVMPTQTGGQAPQLGVYRPPSEQVVLGDVRLGADLRLYGTYGDRLTVALGAQAFVPTGKPDSYTGDGNPRVAPRVSAAGQWGMLEYAAQVGLHLRTRDDVAYGREYGNGGRVGHEFTAQVATGVRLANGRVVVGPELYGRKSFGDTDGQSSPVEALLGGHFGLTDSLRLSAGAGAGLTKSYGAPVVRGIFGFEWVPASPPEPKEPDEDNDGVPDEVDACPKDAGVASPEKTKNGCPPPPSDRDGDGVPDGADACPDVLGMRSVDPRQNGCLPDRDGDGIPDTQDACGEVKGVPSSDPLWNGCVPDHDHDGVLDADDACPDKPGPRRADPASKRSGCPEEDTDKDGINDELDACPNEPGKPNPSDPKLHGCPSAVILGGAIQIRDQVQFRTGTAEILKSADNDATLGAVLGILQTHPEITKVRIEGHTDDQGAAAANKRLSQGRADSVKRWLVGKGIAAGRLATAGFGQDKPLAPNDSDANRAKNRRVEFQVESAGGSK